MTIQTRISCAIAVMVFCLALGSAAWAAAPAPQRDFASPEEAVDALVAALRDQKEADLRAVLGPEADRLVDSGDRYADQEIHKRFVALFDQKHMIQQPSQGHAELD